MMYGWVGGLTGDWRCETSLSPPVKYFTDRSKVVLLLWGSFVLFMSCVCHVFASVLC